MRTYFWVTITYEHQTITQPLLADAQLVHEEEGVEAVDDAEHVAVHQYSQVEAERRGFQDP